MAFTKGCARPNSLIDISDCFYRGRALRWFEITLRTGEEVGWWMCRLGTRTLVSLAWDINLREEAYNGMKEIIDGEAQGH